MRSGSRRVAAGVVGHLQLRMFLAGGLLLAGSMVQAQGQATGPAAPAFEVLGASAEGLVLRENLPVRATDTDACRYPGLDPSEYVGAQVHVMPLTPAAQRGRLFEPALGVQALPLHAPSSGSGCTTPEQAGRHWQAIVERAKSLGIALAAKAPQASVLGQPVPARSCELRGRDAAVLRRCSSEFVRPVGGGRSVRIAVSVLAVPEAPDPAHCQFVGHRVGVAVQVSGLDFAAPGAPAPGGFVTHHDCRAQQVEPWRLYVFGDRAVLLGGFRGSTMADGRTHPFVVTFPTRPLP